MKYRVLPSVALSRSLALAIRSLRRRVIHPAVLRVSFRLGLLCNKGERRFVHGSSSDRGGPSLKRFEIRDEGIEPVGLLFEVSSVVLSLSLEIRSLLRGASSGGCGCIFVLQSRVRCCACFPFGSPSSIKETPILPVRFGRFRGCPFFTFVFDTLDSIT